MNFYYIRSFILITTGAIPVVIGAYRYRLFDQGTKIFFYIAVLGLVDESVCYYLAKRYHNNLVAYNVFDMFEVFMTCLYFNYTIRFFRKRNIGLMIGIVSVAIGIVSNVYLQSFSRIASYFLFYEALITITMSIVSLSSFLKHDDARLAKKEVHFWFPVILISFWSLNYLFFTLMSFYADKPGQANGVISFVFLISVIANIGIAWIFSVYPKLQTNV